MAGRVQDRSPVRRVLAHRGKDRGRGMSIVQTMDTFSRLLDGIGAGAVDGEDEAFG